MGGAWYFATRLAEFVEGQPGRHHRPRGRAQCRFDLPLLPGPTAPVGRGSLDRLARPAGAGDPGGRVQGPRDEGVGPRQDRAAGDVHDVGGLREEGHLHRGLRKVAAVPDPGLPREGATRGDPRPPGVRTPRRGPHCPVRCTRLGLQGRGDVVQDRGRRTVLQHDVDHPWRFRQQRRDDEQPRPQDPRQRGARTRLVRTRRPTCVGGSSLAQRSRGLRLHRLSCAGSRADSGRRAPTGTVHRHRRLPLAVPARGVCGRRRGLEGSVRARRVSRWTC